MAHQFDGLVMIPNCDKNVPGASDGSSPCEYSDDFCQWRTNAGRACQRQQDHLPVCLKQLVPMQQAHFLRKMCVNLKKDMSDLWFLLGHVHSQ